MRLADLANLDIAILGAGREGRATWRWLRTHLPDRQITIYDEKFSAESLALFDRDTRVVARAGPFDAALLAGHEVLIRSPGISPYRPELKALKGEPCQVTSPSNLWFSNFPREKTICITGTKGKSTTAALVAHLLSAAGQKTQLAGNIGEPLLACNGEGIDWWVIELSSYQLADLQARPAIAAITNISDEHLDWHGDAQAYRSDKLRLATLAGDAPLVLNYSDSELQLRFGTRNNSHWFGRANGWHVEDDTLKYADAAFPGLPRGSLKGAHNLENLAAALTIIAQTGVAIDDLSSTLQSFRGLPHRLQHLGEKNGIQFVNDSLSTTPVATIAALQAFRDSPVILIVGGLDRGLDWRPHLPQIMEAAPVAMICMPDSGAAIAALMQASDCCLRDGIHCVDSLGEAMETATALAGPGSVVLLSPGAPSFPRFRDYADRGSQFADLAGLSP